ncbi:type B 50S ribosomal protein L31 [Kineococcus sp. NUM-3379]
MKKDIHPDYRPVVFRDRSGGLSFLTRSTAAAREEVEWEDGRTYPVVDVDISAASHPFWTGTSRVMDTEGRVERFRRRYGSGAKG